MTEELFYWDTFQGYWVRVPYEVQDFLCTIPEVQTLQGQGTITLKLMKTEMSQEDVDNLPKVIR